jgi:hypothetical protein
VHPPDGQHLRTHGVSNKHGNNENGQDQSPLGARVDGDELELADAVEEPRRRDEMDGHVEDTLGRKSFARQVHHEQPAGAKLAAGFRVAASCKRHWSETTK